MVFHYYNKWYSIAISNWYFSHTFVIDGKSMWIRVKASKLWISDDPTIPEIQSAMILLNEKYLNKHLLPNQQNQWH